VKSEWLLAAALMSGVCFAGGVQAADRLGSAGERIFERYCASCHGVGGEGNGPVSPLFKVPPPSLIRLAMSNGGQFPRERLRMIDA
jgi:mono/diheme cytochrome c family protein